MKLPIKTRILEWAIEQNRPITSKECSEVMQGEYPGEKIAHVKWIEKQLDMYTRVNVMEAQEVTLDEKGELLVKYMITDEGKTFSKYIPKL